MPIIRNSSKSSRPQGHQTPPKRSRQGHTNAAKVIKKTSKTSAVMANKKGKKSTEVKGRQTAASSSRDKSSLNQGSKVKSSATSASSSSDENMTRKSKNDGSQGRNMTSSTQGDRSRSKTNKPDAQKTAQKRRKSSTDKSTTTTPVSKKRKRPVSTSLSEKSLTVPRKQYSKWQPVKQTTLSTVVQVLDGNISDVLSMCSTRSYRESQDKLQLLKHRLMTRLKKLEVPVPNVDYSILENTLVEYERHLHDKTDHIQHINDELTRLENIFEEGEEQKNMMQKNLQVARGKIQQQSGDRDLHHDVLNLPRLPGLDSLKPPALLSPQRPGGNRNNTELNNCVMKVVQSKQKLEEINMLG